MDVYQAIPKVCQNGEISVVRKSFSFMFVDASNGGWMKIRQKSDQEELKETEFY